MEDFLAPTILLEDLPDHSQSEQEEVLVPIAVSLFEHLSVVQVLCLHLQRKTALELLEDHSVQGHLHGNILLVGQGSILVFVFD